MHGDERRNALHALVIGGTGMLKRVCLHLAGSGYVVSVVGRSRNRLSALEREAVSVGGGIVALAVDYCNGAAFAEQVTASITANGPISLTVSWIHSTAPQAPFDLGRMINTQGITTRFFDVLGSAASRPTAHVDERAKRFALYENVRYRQIILGFKMTGKESRWLTHDEISQGVITALEDDPETSTIGVTEPWELRP